MIGLLLLGVMVSCASDQEGEIRARRLDGSLRAVYVVVDSEKEPAVSSDAPKPVDILARETEGKLTRLVIWLPKDAKELRVGGKAVQTMPYRPAAEPAERHWERTDSKLLVRNTAKRAIVWVIDTETSDKEDRLPTAGIVLPGRETEVPLPPGARVRIFMGENAYTVPKTAPTLGAESSPGWGFVPLGEFRFSAVQGEGSFLWWPGFRPKDQFTVSTTYGLPTSMGVDPDEFDATLGSFSLGFTVEKFEVGVSYLFGEGEGKEGRFDMSDLGVTGKLDYDVRLHGWMFFVGRPFVGYDGKEFDLLLGATIAALYLRTKYESFRVKPDDPLLPTEDVPGSARESAWMFAAFLTATASYRVLHDPLDISLRLAVGRYFGDGEGTDLRASIGIQYRF